MINIHRDFKILLLLAKLSELTDTEIEVMTKFCSQNELITFVFDERKQLLFAFEAIFDFRIS